MRYDEYYWKRVTRLDPEDSDCKCLIWKGPFSGEVPVADIGGQRLTGYALAWIVDGGMLSDGPFVRTCRTPGCVAVEHVRMKTEDPLMDDMCFDERLDDGFRMIDLGEDEDLSDDEEW